MKHSLRRILDICLSEDVPEGLTSFRHEMLTMVGFSTAFIALMAGWSVVLGGGA